MREVGVAQARGEVERADHLCHADTGATRRTGVAVSHVRRGFFSVGVDALDFRPALHFGESPTKHRGNHEHVRDTVALQHVRKALSTGYFCHFILPFQLSSRGAQRRGMSVGTASRRRSLAALGMTALSLGHLMASGLVGDPTAPVMGSAGPTNRNSYTLSAAQSSARSFT